MSVRGVCAVMVSTCLVVTASAQPPPSRAIEFTFREGTEIEAVPSPDGRKIALQLWRHIGVLDAENHPLLDDVCRPRQTRESASRFGRRWQSAAKVYRLPRRDADQIRMELRVKLSATRNARGPGSGGSWLRLR